MCLGRGKRKKGGGISCVVCRVLQEESRSIEGYCVMVSGCGTRGGGIVVRRGGVGRKSVDRRTGVIVIGDVVARGGVVVRRKEKDGEWEDKRPL